MAHGHFSGECLGAPAMANGKSLQLNLLIIFCLLVVTGSTAEADWPTYRHDNARSGYTSESLDLALRVQWVYAAAHRPCPAWSGPGERPREGFELRDRVIFDDAFQVSAVGGVGYFGSS